MKGLPRLLSHTGFRHQLVLTFTVGIACLALISSLVTATLSSRSVRTNIIEQGRQATQSFALQSTLALLYQSGDNARDAVETTLAFPDVRALAIYDLEHNLLLAEGNKTLLRTPHKRWPSRLELESETERYWNFIAPVYTRHSANDEEMFPFESNPDKPELLGHVRVIIGKDTLSAMTSDILQTTFLVSGALATVLLLLLLGITSRVTTPINNLSEIMRRAEQGEKNLRAEVRGPRDIIQMEMAFNTMMVVLEAREVELEKARDTAIEAARIKGEFAANVSHELRTPLNGILGMLELLFSMDLTPKQHEYAKVAHNSGEALLELIDDVLDFSRVKAGKLKPTPIDFYLHETMEDVVGLLSGQADRKNLALNYHISDNTPTALRGEAGFIRQLLLNLAGNAIKYTEQGSIRLSAYTFESDQGMQLHFEIKDSGIGIPEANQESIFEAFSQVDASTTRKFEGTGLGLAICRQLVELLKGKIGVESKPGSGSTFWFTTPIEIAKGLPAKARQRTNELAALRILVVDSEDTGQGILQQALNSYEIRCTHSPDGTQAITELQHASKENRPYEITIVDEQLDDMKGIELLRRILNDPVIADTKVIIAASRTFGRNEAQLAGIAGCLIKPIEDTELLEVISNVVNGGGYDADSSNTEQLPSTAGLLGLRILVAEDNHANQTVAIGMLNRLGCHPEVVFNGTEAVTAVNSGNYDLVLMDCHMPEMDGYEATSQIRKLGNGFAQTPIIAMTANTRPGDADKCIEAGMNDYLPKPLKLKNLRQKLLQWFPAAPIALCSPPPAEMPVAEVVSSTVLDHEVLSELHYSIGHAIVQVIQAFLEDMPIHLNSLEKGVHTNDPQLVAEFAHTIKGSSRNLGATKLSDISMALEDLGRAGSLEGAMELLHQLGDAWNEVRQALEQEQNLEIDFELENKVQQQVWHPRIMVVDDDRGMRFALRNVLEEDGYHIEEAANGNQALALCERNMPDLVLLDAIMPNMDGFNACRRIQQLPEGKNTPILIITSLDDEQSIDRAFASGAIDYIPKPVHFAVLRQRVARLLHAGKAEKQIRRLAYHDSLTGLANRAHFNGRLKELLSTPLSEGRMVAVLFLDLDRFKLVNDTLGHAVGDLLLKAVAERIQGTLRTKDLVARLGGDEFTIILEEVNSTEVVAKIASKICRTLSTPFVFSGQEIYVAASIGIALYPTDGQDCQTIIKHADTAMYRAKEQGGGYYFYKEGMEAAASQMLMLQTEIRQALERDEMVLYYQPQANLSTGEIIGAEALIRWNHPERGLVSPGAFIPQAEETGLIINIGEWVMQEACRQIREWQDRGHSIPRISINLSPRHLEAQDIVAHLARLLKKTGVASNLLELEITESAIMKRADETILVLHAFKEMDFSLAIDDFGIGYSSLSYLKRFPIDRLKIDQSFVRDITTDPEDAAIIKAIIALARSLQLEVIAEGVETEDQKTFLYDQGCDLIQGYHLGRPVPANEFEASYLSAAPQDSSASANH